MKNETELELLNHGQPSIELLLDAARGPDIEDATYVGDEDRPYVPPAGAKVEHGIQNIDSNTNIQLLRQEGVRRNPKTGQIEPRRPGPVSPSRIKHLPGRTAEEKRARVRVAAAKLFAVNAKENKGLLRRAGQLPRNHTVWYYKDSAGYAVEGNLLNQYNENWDDVQAIAQEQDQNPARFENQAINESEGAPQAGNSEDELINPHATGGQDPTDDERRTPAEARPQENEHRGRLRDLVYDNLPRHDKQIYDAFAEGKTANAITEEFGYTTAQIASFKRRLKRREDEVIAANQPW